MKIQKTSIAEFTHPETSSQIALVGNRHYASKNYMGALGARLDEYQAEGATVHYEGIVSPTEAEIADFTLIQRSNYLALKGLLNVTASIFNGNDLVSIRSVMKRSSPHWEHHDTTIADLARQATFRQSLALGAIGAIVKLVDYVDEDGDMYTKMYKDMQMDSAEEAKDDTEDPTEKISSGIMHIINPLIVGYRNDIALDAVDTSLAEEPSQHLALLWGDGHVAGLSEGLVKRGYQRSSLELLDPRM